MNLRIVGEWDGTHVWLQWDPSIGSVELQIRFKKKDAPEWGEWRPPIRPSKSWHVQLVPGPLGTAVQARIRHVGDDNSTREEWQIAEEAKFVRSVCNFEFSSRNRPLHFIEKTMFHAKVDGAAVAYRLTKEIEVAAGGVEVIEMEASLSSGWSQLDKENDFYLRPALGVVIRNVEPSRNDIEETGRDFTELATAKRDGPFTIVSSQPQNIR